MISNEKEGPAMFGAAKTLVFPKIGVPQNHWFPFET